MMYNGVGWGSRGGGYYLEFLKWSQMTTMKKELDLLYLLCLLKIILLDLFAEIHKSCVKFALLRSPYTFRFQLT